MKKILFGIALSLTTLSFAQQYPDNGWGNDGYYGNNNGYYSDDDDRNYFPDDYYYDYPKDYYPNDYYQSYYNDYRNSIVNINWNVFFRENRLSPWQIDQILQLNNLYISFSSWNNFYRYNPDRWYYDRFYALERIMGPRVFVAFQNNYYHGYSPVVYFRNYRNTYYAPRFRPIPRYRNVNINIYRVDRTRFDRRSNPTFNIVRSNDRPNNGFRGSVKNGNAGFRNQNQTNSTSRNNNSGGFRNENSGIRNNSGFRGNSGNSTGNNGGFRRNEVKRENPGRNENNGFRNNGGGFRQKNEAAPKQNSSSGNRSNSGFRNSFTKN